MKLRKEPDDGFDTFNFKTAPEALKIDLIPLDEVKLPDDYVPSKPYIGGTMSFYTE